MSDFYAAGLRAALLSSAAVVVMAAPAMAQGEKAFNIPAQDAVSAVPNFVQQSDMQVLATASDLKGVRTNAVRGTMAPNAALDALIRGTGLSVKSRDAASVVLVRAVTADAAATPAATEGPVESQPDVIVTGVRKSLREALDTKRHQTGIMEAVSSKDIGALPDVTIAETLNRLPGVNTARDRGNDSQASIRGLGARLVLGTVNGREVASSEPDRNVRWEIYPSEVISGAAVYKSSEARLISGGISGTIDLQTLRPLDYRGPSLVVRAGPVYYNGGGAFPGYDGMGYRGSLSYIARLTPDLGLVVGLTSQKQKNGFESVQGWGYNAGTDNGPVVLHDPTRYNTPWGIQAEAKKLTEMRAGASLGLQYKPTDSFQLGYDLLYSDVKIDENQDQAWWGDGVWGNWDGGNYANYTDGAAHAGKDATIVNGDVVAATVTWAGDRSVVARYTEDKTLLVTGLNGQWKTGPWTVSADASYSKAERFNVWRAAEFQYWPNYMRYDFTGKPAVTVSSDPDDNWQTPANGQFETGRVGDDLKALHVDVRRNLGGTFTALLFGARVSDRTKESGDVSGTVSPSSGSFDPKTLLTAYRFKNFDIPTMLTGDFGTVARAIYNNGFDFDPHATPVSDRIEEKVAEAYAEGTYDTTFASVPLDGNIGVRVVDVTSTSHGTSTELGAWVETPPGSGVWVQQMAVTSVSGGTGYTKVLPSATARFSFGDGRYLKLSAAQVLSRPPLNDMIITRKISASAPYSGSSGNPYLKPFEAAQIDISYEWYYGKDALAAASAYHKSVSHFVGYASRTEVINGNSYALISPVNSTKGGTIDGIELTWQTPLGFVGLDHLGIYSNYAYVSSTLKEMTANLPMNGLARNTATLDLWYSDHGIDARLGTKYHSEYTAIYGWSDSALIRVRPETTMDFSISYQVNPHIQVRFQANNLLDTPLKTYQDNQPTRLGRYDFYGQRVLLDLTVKY
ncbi:MAG: TonB-dependent receptor [Asticcacaulis sp.]|nr:TonB-dependent receptor [Asticcacaulis sp.]